MWTFHPHWVRNTCTIMSGGFSKPGDHSSQTAMVAMETYAVTCVCGRRHEGPRLADCQVLECDRCGRRLFVLPECPYPEIDGHADNDPPESRRKKKSNRRRSRDTRIRQNPAETPQTDREELPESAVPADAPNAQGVESDSSGLVLPKTRRFLSPLWLVVGLIVVLLVATGYWQNRRMVRAQAERDFRAHADLGYSEMKERRFGAAYEEFRQAVEALDQLNRDDERSRDVRQMFRECRAASNLLPVSLVEMLDDLRKQSVANPDGWRDHFRTRFFGRWMVLDTTAKRTGGPDGEDWLEIDYPLVVDGQLVQLRVAGTRFSAVKLDDKPKPMIFAVQLESCEPSADGGASWKIHFAGKTAFLWSSFENYRALGFSVGDVAGGDDGVDTEQQLRDRLKTQSEAIGLSK